MPELCLSHKVAASYKNQNRLVGGVSYRYATIRVNDAQTTKSEKLIKFHGKNSLKFKSDGCVRRPKIILFPSSAISCQFFPISNLVEKKGDVLMSFQSFYPGHTALKFRLVALWQLSNCSTRQSSDLLENWRFFLLFWILKKWDVQDFLFQFFVGFLSINILSQLKIWNQNFAHHIQWIFLVVGKYKSELLTLKLNLSPKFKIERTCKIKNCQKIL